MPVEKLIFKERKLRCTDCGTRTTMLLWSNQMAPECACGGQLEGEYDVPGLAPTVIPDDIPGGFVIEHIPGIEGRKAYSRSEVRRLAADMGYVNHVEHVPERGSDKSPYTTRWI